MSNNEVRMIFRGNSMESDVDSHKLRQCFVVEREIEYIKISSFGTETMTSGVIEWANLQGYHCNA